ncbi:hypothetical protein FSP39_021544 [Pinctada imbricata]|uniref:Uncharacterized protein n=1 Tax=Pinctada imbricata TaxID=66713 RepID=A0AA89BSG1_PINIB|nr:hypothetical protein FSP39_021544 [Pinctada imbricata]
MESKLPRPAHTAAHLSNHGFADSTILRLKSVGAGLRKNSSVIRSQKKKEKSELKDAARKKSRKHKCRRKINRTRKYRLYEEKQFATCSRSISDPKVDFENFKDIKGQTLSISGYLTLFWLDSRLSWYNTSATSQDYSNVRFLFSTEQYVWRPAIIIENSVEDISVISDPQIPMRIASVGGITWSPSGIYKVSCESDTTYYPMDYQICTIKVSTWGYTSHEIQLVYDKATPVELGFYSPNGEWDLISGVGTTTKEKSRGGQTFSSLTFQVSLQRRPMFHILNTLFPVALMAFLIPLVFKLPPDSGEKIGYALTVLLAYAVYLTLISDNIPSTSVTICYLSIYLALTLMYGTLSVLFVILVLMAHHKPETEEVPGCVSSLISGVLMPLVCWKGRCCCCRRKKSGSEVTDISIPKNKVSDIALLKSKMAGITEKPKLFDDDEDDNDEKEEMTWPLVSTCSSQVDKKDQGPPPPYSTDLETSLRDELFTNYSVLQRPSALVNVRVSLTLLTINDMNIREQTLSASGYLTLVWRDTRLSWNDPNSTSQDFSNVNFLFSTETHVWRPAIIIENSVVDISVINDKHIPMRIKSDGRISWSPAGIYVVSCDADITFYPLDYQRCLIKVSTWGYTQSEIQLIYDVDSPVNQDFYSPNGEWDLLAADGTKMEEKSRDGQTFSTLEFQIDIRRRPLFHILNTLFPVALMAVLIPMAFKLPPESGEKIGYTLTVLLAYAVYLTLISDNIPSTSITVCYLSIYLALILMYGTLSVLLAIFVLVVHHKSEQERIPSWLNKLTINFLIPCVCWRKGAGCKKKNEMNFTDPVSHDDILIEAFENGKPRVPDKAVYSEPDEVAELKWQTIAKILDTFFYRMMNTLVLLTTLVIFSVIIAHYGETI